MYIVWKEPYGYFVSYKDKSSDKYSKNWYDAKKYIKIGPALNKLGLVCPKYLTSFEKFIELNNIDNLSVNRDKLLSDILSEKQEVKIGNFINGKIYKVIDNEIIGNADEDIIKYINNLIESNVKRMNKFNIYKDKDLYKQPKQTSNDTWEGFY